MELKFMVLLVIAAVAAEDTFCKPRALFKMSCNTCTCSSDGRRAACTLKACPVDPSITTDNVEASSAQVCNPGTKFNDYCNTCGCASDGSSFVCTKMLCDKNVWNKDGSLKKATKSERATRAATEQVCHPGTKFNDYCNICGCASDGSSFICTKMLCDKNVWNIDGSLKLTKPEIEARSESNEVCEPGTKFNDYCNTCGCASDGSSFICTKMLCDKNIWNKDGTLKANVKSKRNTKLVSNQVCEPGSKFNDYCNTCSCASDGSSFVCTKMLCNRNVWNRDGTLKVSAQPKRPSRSVSAQVCEPGKKFKDYCNSCTCAVDGTSSICTRMWCDKNLWNKDGTTKVNVASDKTAKPDLPNKICEPGKVFHPDSCNICRCGQDGLRHACTFKLCTRK